MELTNEQRFAIFRAMEDPDFVAALEAVCEFKEIENARKCVAESQNIVSGDAMDKFGAMLQYGAKAATWPEVKTALAEVAASYEKAES